MISQSQAQSPRISGTVVLGYMLLTFTVLVAILLMSLPAALQLGLTMVTGYVLLTRFANYVSDQKWMEVALELFPIAMMWGMFCAGGTIALTEIYYSPELALRYRFFYYTDESMLLTTVYVVVAMILYSVVFRAAYQHARNNLSSDFVPEGVVANIVIISLLGFDFVMRAYLIVNGRYFSRILNENIEVQTSLLYHAFLTLQFVNIALLIYLSRYGKPRIVFLIMLLIMVSLVLMQGQRSTILFSAFVAILTYGTVYSIKKPMKLLVLVALVVGIFDTLIGPAIQIARNNMLRANEVPASSITPLVYLIQYLPDTLWAMLTNYEKEVQQVGQGLDVYIAQYPAIMASVNQRLINMDVSPNTDAFVTSLLTVVPRAIYPEKGSIPAGLILQLHYGFNTVISSTRATDLQGSPITDVFSMAHLPGVIFLITVCSAGVGFFAGKLQNRLGLLGLVIALGLAPIFNFSGDSFGAYLTLVRNVLLLLAWVNFLFLMSNFKVIGRTV